MNAIVGPRLQLSADSLSASKEAYAGSGISREAMASLVSSIVTRVMAEMMRREMPGVPQAAKTAPPFPPETQMRQHPVADEIGKLREQLFTQTEQIGEFMTLVGAQDRKISALEKKVEAKERKAGAKDRKISALRRKLGVQKKQIGTRERQIGALQRQFGDLQSEVGKLRDQVEGSARSPQAAAQSPAARSKPPSAQPASTESVLPDRLLSSTTTVDELRTYIAPAAKNAALAEKITQSLRPHVEAGSIKTAAELREMARFIQSGPPAARKGWFGYAADGNQTILREAFSSGGDESIKALKKLVLVENLLKGADGIFGRDYSWNEIAAICGSNIIVPGGGGHGDVFFIKDTPFTVKQRLNPSEGKAYKRLNESGGTFFRKPFAFDETRNFVVIRNALWSDAGSIGGVVTKDKAGRIVSNNLFDLKIGGEWMVKAELRCNGDERPEKELDDKYKRVNAMRGDDKEKPFGLIERGDVYVDGQLQAGGGWLARMPGPFARLGKYFNSQDAYSKTNDVLAARINGRVDGSASRLTDDQLFDLADQAYELVAEAEKGDYAFVGSSVMIAFPDGPDKPPQLVPIDFAHAVWVEDVSAGRISQEDYDAIRSNYLKGLEALRDNIVALYEARQQAAGARQT